MKKRICDGWNDVEKDRFVETKNMRKTTKKYQKIF